MAAYHQEVKDDVVHGHTPKKIRIPTNETSEITHLTGVWQQVVKDVAYQHLDLIVRHMKYHTRRQWEAIYEELEEQFYYDPL